jgi:hypothetical protein
MDSRAIQNRLDSVVTPFKWRNEYVQWHGNAQVCGISIYDDTRNIWVTKFDGAENTNIEPVKGGLSDSFKRAAVMWGIGRYLYNIPGKWVGIEPKGKGHQIKESEMSALEKYYNAHIGKAAGNASPEAPASPSGDKKASGGKSPSAPEKGNEGNSKPNSDAGTPNGKDKPKNANPVYFKVKSSTETGKTVTLTLLGKGNKEFTAYARKGSQGLKSGVLIKNAVMEEKQNEFGIYYLLNQYEIENTAA